MEHFQEKVGLSLLLSLLTGVFAWVAFAHAPLSALCVTLGALACWLVGLFFAAPFYTAYRDRHEACHQQQALLLEGRARAKALQLNEACPSAQLVRLPYADNEFAYYLLGRADEWRMKGLPNY